MKTKTYTSKTNLEKISRKIDSSKRKKHKQRRKQIKQSQAEFRREESKIIELMKKTAKHDHKKCNCEGCYWWVMTATITKNSRFYEVVPSWKNLDRDEWLRISQAYLKRKIDTKMKKEDYEKYFINKGIPSDKAKQMATIMLTPVFMVMYKRAPSPMGLLRDI